MNKVLIKLIVLSLIPVLYQCKKEVVVPNVPIEVESIIQNVTVFDGSDGSIDLTVTGGYPPYSFYWSNSKATEDLENIAAGEYVVVISDYGNQIKTSTFEILQPAPDAIILTFDVHYPTTNNGNDGSINLLVSGGYPPFTILWSTGAKTEKISKLSSGIYMVTVTDSKDQIKKDTVPLNNFIVDIEGNCYTTVQIGNQTWMQQNLRASHAANGEFVESYLYNNDTTFLKNYGRLYSWDAIMNGSSEERTQGICPNGWRIPTDEDYKILEKELGMSNEDADLSNTWRGTNVGTKLKIGGSSGFNALLSGRKLDDGTFSYIDYVEYLWTSTESGSEKAWRRSLDKTRNEVGRFDSSPKSYGFSIRCIKND